MPSLFAFGVGMQERKERQQATRAMHCSWSNFFVVTKMMTMAHGVVVVLL